MCKSPLCHQLKPKRHRLQKTSESAVVLDTTLPADPLNSVGYELWPPQMEVVCPAHPTGDRDTEIWGISRQSEQLEPFDMFPTISGPFI